MSTQGNTGNGRIATRNGALRGRTRSLLAGVSVLALAATPAFAEDGQQRLRYMESGAAPGFDLGPIQLAQATTTEARRFDIPAGDLQAALLAFSQAVDLQLLYPAEMTAGLRTEGVQGEYTSEDALRRLLAGTGLQYRFSDADTVTLAKAGAPYGEGPLQLGPITVEGQADYGTGQIGNLPPEYPGGQVARGSRVGVFGNRDVFDTPLNNKAYTDKLIRDQQSTDIVDVVENDPSVNVNLHPSTGNQFLVRGLALFNAEFLIDGLSGLNTGGFTTTTGYERVEIIKGPDAMLSGINVFGSSAGGSVNLVPKRAQDEPINRVTASYQNDTIGGVQADIGRRFGDDNAFGVRLDASHREGDTPIDLQSRRDSAVALGLDYQGARFRAALDLRYSETRVDAFSANILAGTGFELPGPLDASSNPKQAWEFLEEEALSGIITVEYDVLDNLTASAKYGRSHGEGQSLASNLIFLSNSQGDFSSGAFFFPTEESNETAQGTLRGDFATGPLDHEIAFVASGTWKERSTLFQPIAGTAFNSNIFNPVRVPKPSTAGLQTDPPKTSETIVESFALADTVSAFDDRVQLTIGGRHQTVQTKSFSATTGQETSDVRQSEITPALGVVFKPIKNLSLYGNYMEAVEQGPSAPAG